MIKIEIEKNTGMVFLDKIILGRDMENLQEKIQFVFKDTFVDGVGRFEYKLPNGEKHYILANKINDTYEILVKNVILLTGYIYMQFVVTESETEDGIPVFKSNVFKMFVKESINSVTDAPDDYELWIETANAKLLEIQNSIEEADNLNITAEKEENKTTITITDKQGVEHTTEVLDGEKGDTGEQGPIGPQGLPGTNGQDGRDGRDGVDGQDGFSPIANVNKVGKVATITITDKLGTTTAQISDGEEQDLSSYYTKTEIDTKLEDYATKEYVNSLNGNNISY